MRKAWIVTGIVAVLSAGAIGAAAPGERPDPAEGHHAALHRFVTGQLGRMMTLHSDINLTDQQKEQIHGIVMKHHQEIITTVKPLAQNARTLKTAVLADKTDEQAIRAAAADVGKSLGDAAVLAARIKTEAKQVLTPEQQQTMQNFHQASDKAVDQLIQEAAQ